MTDNKDESMRGKEHWRCSLCTTINDMLDDVCQGCHFDYMSDIDPPVVTIQTVKKKKTEETVTIDIVSTENDSTVRKHHKNVTPSFLLEKYL